MVRELSKCALWLGEVWELVEVCFMVRRILGTCALWLRDPGILWKCTLSLGGPGNVYLALYG